MSRPSKYNAATVNHICKEISLGRSLRSICLDEKLPAISTVQLWLIEHKEFSEQYARARDAQADYLAEEILDIADKATDANLARLQVDARKWFASKVAPKKYGDRTTVAGDDAAPVQVKHIVEFVGGSKSQNT